MSLNDFCFLVVLTFWENIILSAWAEGDHQPHKMYFEIWTWIRIKKIIHFLMQKIYWDLTSLSCSLYEQSVFRCVINAFKDFNSQQRKRIYSKGYIFAIFQKCQIHLQAEILDLPGIILWCKTNLYCLVLSFLTFGFVHTTLTKISTIPT